MTRVRTLDFLPEIFQTPSNRQFLSATLDQLVNPPVTKKIQGYVGSKFGYGINANDFYVTEPNKTRTDYQLDPGVIFTKNNNTIAEDFLSYPGLLDALKALGGVTNNNNRLFNSQFYSWDSFTDLDKIINFNQYYWLPDGAPAVTVASATVFTSNDFVVTDLVNGYNIRTAGTGAGSINPTITLLRGGSYNFYVDQDSQFWIQAAPGVSGTSPTQPNLSVRDIFGVSNNGATQGVVTFTVPSKNAQDEFNFPGNNPVGVVSDIPFSLIQGQPVSSLTNGIDGITSLEGLTVMFYNTGLPNEVGYTSEYYDESNYDTNNNVLVLPKTINITATSATGNLITCSSTEDLIVGQTITFVGAPFGNLNAYSPASSPTVNAGNFVIGQQYYITNLGNTDFTLIGAPNNDIGTIFTATGIGFGTGVATQYTPSIYYVESIANSTQFSVSLTLGGSQVALTNDVGAMTANINQGLFQEGFETVVADNFYLITYVGTPDSPVIKLIPAGEIPINEKIVPTYGTEYIGLPFYKNTAGTVLRVPFISAPLDTLYYQDGTTANKVGIIKLIESNITNTLNVETDIIGKKNFTSTNGVVFTNGLKVEFDGDVIPRSYLQGQYYVQGVGTAIELIPTQNLLCPEPFTVSTSTPYDILPYDIGNYDSALFVPATPDYITIARNALNRNPWSRSNRWFHIDVINATAQYNNNPSIAIDFAKPENKARRPIIEFYPNLKLYNQGTVGKDAIDYIDYRSTDAFNQVAGQTSFYPDVEVYSNATGTLNGNFIINAGSFVIGETYEITTIGTTDFTLIGAASNTIGETFTATGIGSGNGTAEALTYTTFVINASDVTGTLYDGLFLTDSSGVLPSDAQIISITGTSTLTITLSWSDSTTFSTQNNVSFVANQLPNNNYILFPNSRIVFAADENEDVRNKIYVVSFSTVTIGSDPVITLTEAPDGEILINDQITVLRGYNYQGQTFWYDGIDWVQAQQKLTVNQPPLFDVYNDNGVSFGDKDIYTGTSFNGCTLFAYGIGEGTKDPVLGFPIRYSQVPNVGDISFDVTLNSDTFDYVSDRLPITEKVNTGYVYNYVSRDNYERLLGWQTAVGQSVQYQIFEFSYVAPKTPQQLMAGEYFVSTFTCDVPMLQEEQTPWPTIEVYVNNKLQDSSEYTITVTSDSTIVNLNLYQDISTQIEIVLLSNGVSQTAYYSVPINLNNNPFNTDITVANVGDIRGQYQSIFVNCPDSQGDVFGSNNFRDLGNVVPYGNKIIQNSASLVLPAAFLRNPKNSLFDALLYNSREYVKFKQMLVDVVNNSNYTQRFDASYMLDDALDQMTASKNQEQPFFWSDMIPSKAPFVSNTYNFQNALDSSIYPLTRVYNYTTANYYGVLVYLTTIIDGVTVTKQLIKDVDYVISSTAPSLTISTDLNPGDVVTIKEYNQTYGSYIPNTPTKLGLYPAYLPQVVYDTSYSNPTYFIQGHDGSYNKLYGNYDETLGVLIDFRDQVLLEFELRVYNNLKLSSVIPIQEYEVVPGYFRNTSYSYNEWLEIYTPLFLDWVGQNRIDYKTQLYNQSNPFTWNYTNDGNRLDNQPIPMGNFRGIYEYFYDTSTPYSTPWKMLGYVNQPDWWTTKYGPAPYTNQNLILWQDLENGYDWNNGNPRIIEQAKRPGLMTVLPITAEGNLQQPLDCIVGNYNPNKFRRDWKVGDLGPAEYSYRKSSTYPFDFVRMLSVMAPAKLYNLAVDLDNYKYNVEFNQYLVNNRSHLVPSQIEIYGNGTAKTSYINWIVDYQKQVGIDATKQITDLLFNLDVRLVYRIAGFSDKTLLKFFVEKGTPNSINSSLLIPDESYALMLYENQPYGKLVYSSVIIQSVPEGYRVYGNSQTNAYFFTLKPLFNGNYDTIRVEKLSARVATEYSTVEQAVPYGTLFYNETELCQFLINYGKWLQSRGAKFDNIENGIELNWSTMAAEFLYWAQTGWEIGSITTLNPFAKLLKIEKENEIVQPLTLQQTNFVLNQNLYPIQNVDLAIVRDGTMFTAETQNEGDTIAYGQFNLSNFEHAIVFDNVTLFNDVIYNLVTGLRQSRIYLNGTKTAEWNGTVNASGFILNQDNITEWKKDIVYTKGSIVKFKNKFWTATKIIQPNNVFNERDWKETDYNEIQKGLLPNSSTRSYESSLYYNVDKANLEQDADLLSFSLIGYRPRDYLAIADLTDITQINVYKNMIKNKGTRNSLNAFKGANLPQGGIDYEVYENWAIKSGEFGGTLNNNFVEMQLQQTLLTSNPSLVGLTEGIYTPGVNQEVPLYSLYNYSRPITDPNILSTVSEDTPSTLLPTAGYVNFNDVKMSTFYFPQIATGFNKDGVIVPLNELYVRDYVWVADYQGTWHVYTPETVAQVILVQGLLNNVSTITFDRDHNLTRFQPFAIINFAQQIDGYYIVDEVVNSRQVNVSLSITSTTRGLSGLGVAYKFNEQRVATPADIQNLPLLTAEFTKNTVWVDENVDGSWAVFRKSLNYQYEQEFTKVSSSTYGSAVAYSDNFGYIITDAGLGNLYRYTLNALNGQYQIEQTFSEGSSYGSALAYSQNILVVSEPSSGTPKVYIYVRNNSQFNDNLIPYQTAISRPIAVTGNWGDALALSGDTNWLYISATDDNKVYVYRKESINLEAGYFVSGQTYEITSVGTTDFTLIGAVENKVGIIFVADDGVSPPGTLIGSGTGTAKQITYKESNVIDGSTITYIEDFGYSISTDYYGDTLVVGAPNTNFSPTVENWGSSYVYQRYVQNIEVQSNTVGINAQSFTLGWNSDNPTTYTGTSTTSNITLSSVVGININDPIIFSGNGLTGSNIRSNTVYYVASIVGSTIQIKESRNTSTIFATGVSAGSFSAIPQLDPLYVTVNGILVNDSQYAAYNSTLLYTGYLKAGDIINVSDNGFALVQVLTTEKNPRVGVKFGTSVDTTAQSSEILVGAPFALTSVNQEGAVYRFTNGGGKYGIVIGTEEVNITAQRKIFINGYLITIPNGSNAQDIANIINFSRITNIQAAAQDNKLVIQIINNNLTQANEKLLITTVDDLAFTELGIKVYTQTQTILCPHQTGPTQFGTVVKFNENDSIVVSAPVGIRYAQTTFDFTDDENLDNDTLFDNNTTQFIDSWNNAGAVYMFDYLPVNNETLDNIGAFIYAQSTNAQNLVYGAQPRYGTAIDFNSNRVVIGTPNFRPDTVDGQVITYVNQTGIKDWSVYRESAPVVDINKISNAQIFNVITNNTIVNLDYIDPLQGKLLGIVQENLDCISNIDPASYNITQESKRGIVWGANKVGTTWLDTSNMRFVNYHQNDDVEYNARFWGTLFPASDIAVYTWVGLNVPPSSYVGPGTVYDPTLYTVEGITDQSGIIVPVYYYWVRNSGITFTDTGKTLTDIAIASYIANPLLSGVSYMTPLLPNVFALYNCLPAFEANQSILHIGYSTGSNDDPAHNEYSLIRANYADDFLPGFPTLSNPRPEGLYDRMLDSLAGVDEQGGVVPDPFLPKAVQSGVLARPRQSFFYNRLGALKNYITYANNVLREFPISETRRSTYLFAEGQFYNTTNYWNYINWWAPGYDNNTKSALQVPLYSDLETLEVTAGTIVTVAANGNGLFEVYRYDVIDGNGNWTRIGLQNGTIEFSSNLYDYAQARLGFGDNFYDTQPYDEYPSEETRWIIRALNEQIYTNELLIFRNRSLILLFEYIQSETIESQNYLPWLNKTSLADVTHKIRELKPYEVYQSDNQDFLSGYLNETKPYHVVLKDFLFEYTGEDIFQGDITDFDLPSKWNSQSQQFITPELVYASPQGDDQFLPDNAIWQNPEYTQWFQNKGVSLTGQSDYFMTTLASYVTLASNFMVVDNAQGFPINGTIRVGTELIGYSSVDRALNAISGLIRGVNGTTVVDHIPGENISMDLPPVILLDGGSQYIEPPKVTAYIDTTIYPEPTEAAELEAVMSLDTVLQVNVINPGKGYAVLPEIIIDPSIVITFASTDVNDTLNTIQIYAPTLQTGNLIRYKKGTDGINIGGLIDNQWYYVNLLQSSPTSIIALYSTFADAINDTNRIDIYSQGSGTDHTLNLGAKASAISTSYPVRENNINLRFDRTTYTSQVTDWRSGAFYGAFFAGAYTNSEDVASSSIQLESTQPPISDILASAQGFVVEITDVENDRVVEWSSFVRTVGATVGANNAVRLIPLDGGSTGADYPNASGSTLGFYVGMPVKFVGSAFGGLQVDITYYVAEVINATDFTVSLTEGGSVVTLTSATTTVPGLSCYTAKVTDTAILTVNYPGLLNTTATQSETNKITVPISPIGTGGTNGFYMNMPIFFTGPVFGNIVENTVYYITTVCDNQTVTISETEDPLTITVTRIFGVTDEIIVDSTIGLSVNDPIIFNTFVLAAPSISNGVLCTIINPGDTDFTLIGAPNNFVGTTFQATGPGLGTGTVSTNTFGNIVSGKTYYVAVLVSNTQLQISESINGGIFALEDINVSGADSSSALMTSQVNTLQLTDATGNMTMNVNLPVSPGQVNGQLFNLYNTSPWYTNIVNGTISNLITGTIPAVLGTLDRVIISSADGGTTNFYSGLPIRLADNIDTLVAGTTYYVDTIGVTSLVVTNTSSSGLFTADTDRLYVGMPVTFSGVGLGGIVIGDIYIVDTINAGVSFTVTDEFGNPITLTTANGTMNLTGEPYVTLVGETGFTTTISNVEFTQYYDVSDLPEFDVSWILGGYRVIISNPSSGFAVDNVITIAGTNFADVGGTSSKNDLTLTISEVDSNGAITHVICSGTVPSISNSYYLKVISDNKFAVYSNALMTVPVSGINFNYSGFTQTNAIEVDTGAIRFADLSDFEINDGVIFTGTMIGNLVEGQTYYITSVDTPSTGFITISENPGGITQNAGTFVNGQAYLIKTLGDTDFTAVGASSNTVGLYFIATGSGTGTGTATSVYNIGAASLSPDITMTKPGSFAFLPEPFYFNQSIVKFNNRVYICIISNNDDEFIFGKWEELQSGDRRLNALDRVIGYYQPTVNMPGVDLPQLFTGLEYPNATYLGQPFQPDEQYPLDTVLTDKPFYPTNINLTSVLYDGFAYFVPANQTNYSAIVSNRQGENWDVGQLANAPLALTDIAIGDGVYVVTSRNSATPIYRSNNGITWTTNGYFTPYGSTPYDDMPYDLTSINIAALSLNSVAYLNGRWVAVGDDIVTSDDTYVWRETFSYPNNGLVNQLYSVAGVDIPNFTGFVAVGKGQKFDYSTGVTITVPTNLIVVSTDGIQWIEVASLTDSGLYGVASDGVSIIAVGENGVVYKSVDGFSWEGVNETNIISTNSVANVLNVNSTLGFSAGEVVRFSQSFDTIVAGTSYTISSIISETQLQLTAVTLTGTSGVSNTRMFKYPPTPTLRDLVYANNAFVAVGEDGYITASTDGITWSVLRAGDPTEPNLNGITYALGTVNTWTAVGDNNTILQSTNNGLTWTSNSIFVVQPSTYDVKGDPFTAGYGPEELVPGVVSDQLTMIVSTRAGTNWPATEYAHVGYNVVSLELEPTSSSQLLYSFYSQFIQIPAQISVFQIDYTTGLSTTLYKDVDYTVDWINQFVVLNNPLPFAPTDKLRIDIYEVGNGDQLVKSNTKNNPIRTNSITGFNEIFTDANYSTLAAYDGGGIIRPESQPITATAIASDSATNSIFFDDISNLFINAQIRFSGTVFGGVLENVTYFVKTISAATNSITISETAPGGIAGPTFSVTSFTGGNMIGTLQTGTGIVWTDPIVMFNGVRLVYGHSSLITKVTTGTNEITTITTETLVEGQPIRFCQCLFTNQLLPFTTYYVKEVIDAFNFTISETLNGPVKVFNTTATGTAMYITNDYAIGLSSDEVTAKIILADFYDADVDYLSYSLFGQTFPVIYGYTLPETQVAIADGSESQFTLTNFVGDDNAFNAIVEVNGIRQTISQYTINSATNTILFNAPPASNSTVAITSYNLTDRQYFNTTYGLTGTPGSNPVSIVVESTNNTEFAFDALVDATDIEAGYEYTIETLGTTNWNAIGYVGIPIVGGTFVATGPGTGNGTAAVGYDETAFDENLNWLTLQSGYTTASLNINDSLVFSNPTLDGIVAGQTYYVVEILNSTEFVISDLVDGDPVQLTDDTGAMNGTTNPITVANIISIDNNIVPPVTVNVLGSNSVTDELTLSDTSDVIVGQTAIFKTGNTIDGSFVIGIEYQIMVVGDTDWNSIGYVGTPVKYGTFIANGIGGSGTGEAAPMSYGSSNLLTNGTVYFVKSVDYNPSNSVITLSETPGELILAGNFVPGTDYTILDIGTTDFTLIGAASNTVGLVFTATGAGSGNGSAFEFAGVFDIDTTVSDLMVGFFGGVPAVRVTTGIPHEFVENTLVQIDDVAGSIQLNNNTYYAKVIDNVTLDLYFTPYIPGLNATNDPVTAVSTYISGGYIWRAGLFTLINTIATQTYTGTNLIKLNSSIGIFVDTPILFTEVGFSLGTEIMGGLIAGETYYVRSVDPVIEAGSFIPGESYQIKTLGILQDATEIVPGQTYEIVFVGSTNFISLGAPNNNVGTQFVATAPGTGSGQVYLNPTDFISLGAASNNIGITFVCNNNPQIGTGSSNVQNMITVSAVRQGSSVALDNDTGTVYVTQWEQTNVDRLWVTVNGYRVPSSQLRLNPGNDLSILVTIEPGDEIIVTSMMPSATPNEQTYINFVDTNNVGEVYRANTNTKTWASYALTDLFDTLYVADIGKITNTIVQNVVAPTPVNNLYSIGLTANKTDIQKVTVFNVTKNQLVDPDTYFIAVEALSPILKIQDTNDIDIGDNLIITTIEGLVILVNGEQIKFGSVGEDPIKGSYVSNLQRGYNGTIRNAVIPRYSEIYGLLEQNRMSDIDYNLTWNPIPGIYNITEGDPLQISDTASANFLKTDVS